MAASGAAFFGLTPVAGAAPAPAPATPPQAPAGYDLPPIPRAAPPVLANAAPIWNGFNPPGTERLDAFTANHRAASADAIAAFGSGQTGRQQAAFFGLVPATPKPAPQPQTPQMTGLARAAAFPASSIASGAVSVAGMPGDIARGAAWLGGKEAQAQIQGNPLPTESSFAVPSMSINPTMPGIGPAPGIVTPQNIAAAPGKENPQAWSGHNPLDSETLLGITKRLGLTDRPDLQPQNVWEQLEAAGAKGIGYVLPAIATEGVSALPEIAEAGLPAAIRKAAPDVLRQLRSGVAFGEGAEAGEKVGGAIGGTPGAVIGSLAGGLLPAGMAYGFGKLAGVAQPLVERALPVTEGIRQRVAARSFADAATPDIRAQVDAAAAAMPEVRAAESVLNDPNAAAEARAAAQATIQRLAPQSGVTVPGSHPTTYQLTGSPELGTAERGVANRAQYAPQFNALRQQQNAARVAALGNATGPGDTAAVVPWFQGELQRLRATEDTVNQQNRAGAQAALEGAGQPTTAHDAGAIVRGAVGAERVPQIAASDAALAGAQQNAENATSTLGGMPTENAAQEHGVRMRGAWPTDEEPGSGLLGQQAEETAAAKRLYDTVDPKGNLVVGGVRPLAETAAILRGEQPPFGALPKDRADYLSEIGAANRTDMSGPEARVFDLAAGLGNTAKFSDIRKLSRMAAAAQREIGGNLTLGPASLAYKRIGELRDEIDSTLARAAGEAAQKSPEVAGQLSLLAKDGLEGPGSGFDAGRRLPLPPNAGPDLFGAARAEPVPRAIPEPTIRNDQRQITMPGMEPSAVQAQAARDAVPNTGRVPQQRADEGLFAPRGEAQPELAPPTSRWATASGDNFTDQLHEAPQQGHAEAGDWTRTQGQRTGHEHLAIVDNRTGQVVHAGTSKMPGRLPFNPTFNAEDFDAFTAHHNHPNSTALSQDDMAMLAAPGFSHIIAHGHNGDVTVARLTPAYAALRGIDPQIMGATAAHLSGLYQKSAVLARSLLLPLVRDGTISIDDGNRLFNDVANRLFHAKGVIDYASTIQLPEAVSDSLQQALRKAGFDDQMARRYAQPIRPEERTRSLPAAQREGTGQRLAGSETGGGDGPEISDGGEQALRFRPQQGRGSGGLAETGPDSSEPGATIFTPAGRPINVRYRVAEADSLIPSHTDDLAPNPAFPAELQPRERGRAASQEQVARIAGNLQPERLGPSTTTMEGAPIIGPDGIVESGNGRVLALRRAYAEHPEQAAAYRDWLQRQGYDVAGMKKPVLVGERATELSPQDRVAFTQESNTPPALAMSAAERAGVDATRMGDDILSLWKPGDVDSAANRDFVRAFVRDVVRPDERGALYTPEGNLSLEGAQRIRNALLQRAYGDPALVSAMTEVGDPNIAAFGGALSDAAGDMARLRSEISAGRVEGATDITANLTDALRLVSQARQRRISLRDMAAQSDMWSGRLDPTTKLVLQAAYGPDLTGRISRAKLSELLAGYAEEAQKATTAPRLFGANATPNEILEQRIARAGSEPTLRAADRTGRTGSNEGYGRGGGEGGSAARGPGNGPQRQGTPEGSGAAPATEGQTAPHQVVQFGPVGAHGTRQASFDTSPLKPNFNAPARERLRKANAAWAALKDRFSRGSVGDVLARNPNAEGGFRVPTSVVPSRLFVAGPKGAAVADELIRKFGHDGALQLLGDYPAYSLRKEAQEMGTLSVPGYEKWADTYGPFLAKFPELKASFDTAAKARAVLDDLRADREAIDAAHPIKPGWGDAEVMQRFVKPGPKGYEAAEALVRATGERADAMDATRDYLASELRNAAEIKSGPEAGTVDRAAYRSFMKRYAPFLSHPAMKDVRAAFENVGAAQETLERAAAEHRAAREAYLRSVARHFLPNEARGEHGADMDPIASMGRILGRDDPGPELAELGRQTVADPAAREALQSALVHAVIRQARSNQAVGADLQETLLKNDATQKLIGKLVGDNMDGPARHLLTTQQMRALGDVRMDLRRSNLSISGNRAPGGGSDTAMLTSSREADEHKPHIAGTLAIMESLGEAGQEALGKWGRIASMLLVPIMQAARRAGFHSINDLRAEALLHPEKFSALLAKLPTDEAGARSAAAAIRRQLALASTAAAFRAAQDKRN